jgi:hypothetical protein
MMGMGDRSATERVVEAAGGTDAVDRLVGLPGADLTTLLLEVTRRRAARLTPADVLRRFTSDRFTAPAALPFDRLRATEDRLISLLPQGFELVTLAPVVPLGTHSVVGLVHQNQVLATIRGTEVAADATNGLALLAAARRQAALASRSAEVVHLAAPQRVVRAQQVRGAGRFAHFGLLGLASAGRDTGDLAFERQHVATHARYVMSVAVALTGAGELRLTVADPHLAPVGAAVRSALAALRDVTVVDDPDRVAGHGYYTGLCFKAFAVTTEGQRHEIGDGGLLDWTARLLGNRKERLATSGIGIDGAAAR